MDKWYEKQEEGAIILASEVTLLRNLASYRFAGRLEEVDAAQLVQQVRQRSAGLEEADGMKYYSCSVNRLQELEKQSLQEWSILSEEVIRKGQDTALIISEDEGVRVLVNDENHLHIHTTAAGEDMTEALRRAKLAENCMATLGFARDESYGFLTTSPQDTGTGMHAAYLLFLPGLAMTGKLAELMERISKSGPAQVMFREVYKQMSKSGAFFYRLENRRTMGLAQEEITDNLTAALRQTAELEKQCRERLLTISKQELSDKVMRSYGVLRYAKLMSSEDGMLLLSQLKFGCDLGIITFRKTPRIFEQMHRIQPANIQKCLGKRMSGVERSAARAEYLNRMMMQNELI